MFLSQEQLNDLESLAQMRHRVHVVFVDEAGLLEQERGEVGSVKLAHLVQLHVQLLSLDRHFLVRQPVYHVGEESLESSLVALDSERRVKCELGNVLLASVKTQHDDLLNLVFEDLNDR